jgi:trimethylamine:corrinoid methyltransferase-like protein
MELKLEFLTRDQIERIHTSSLKILEVGVLILGNDFLKFLARNGVDVEYDEKRA